jgi:hypothetical protein
MSEELRKDEELEVEAHRRRFQGIEEPSDEGEEDEVEAHSLRLEVMRKD